LANLTHNLCWKSYLVSVQCPHTMVEAYCDTVARGFRRQWTTYTTFQRSKVVEEMLECVEA